jgi:hypothetical protein
MINSYEVGDGQRVVGAATPAARASHSIAAMVARVASLHYLAGNAIDTSKIVFGCL